jgi:hypothetical protein
MKTKLILLLLLLSMAAAGQEWDKQVESDSIWTKVELDTINHSFYFYSMDSMSVYIPCNTDTIKVIMLLTDTTHYDSFGGNFTFGCAYWEYGYKMKDYTFTGLFNGRYIYLDAYKKELPDNIVIWQVIEL